MVPKIVTVLFLPVGISPVDVDPDRIVVYGQAYWMSLKGLGASNNDSGETIYFSQSQRLTVETIQQWMIAAANREDLSYVPC